MQFEDMIYETFWSETSLRALGVKIQGRDIRASETALTHELVATKRVNGLEIRSDATCICEQSTCLSKILIF